MVQRVILYKSFVFLTYNNVFHTSDKSKKLHLCCPSQFALFLSVEKNISPPLIEAYACGDISCLLSVIGSG